MRTVPGFIAIGAAVLVSGCYGAGVADVSKPPALDRCSTQYTQFISFGLSSTTTTRLSPGGSVTLHPTLYQGPATVSGDTNCVRDLVVTPDDGADDDDFSLVKLDDGRLQFKLSETATPGGSFKLLGKYGSTMSIGDVIYVYDTDRWPLEGVWSQPRAQCGGAAIGELEISREGFSVTWQPFESYRDYWGTYAFVPDAEDTGEGTLTLTTNGGNHMAVGKAPHAIRIKVEGDTLTMLESDFGQPRSGYGVCFAPFTRRR